MSLLPGSPTASSAVPGPLSVIVMSCAWKCPVHIVRCCARSPLAPDNTRCRRRGAMYGAAPGPKLPPLPLPPTAVAADRCGRASTVGGGVGGPGKGCSGQRDATAPSMASRRNLCIDPPVTLSIVRCPSFMDSWRPSQGIPLFDWLFAPSPLKWTIRG